MRVSKILILMRYNNPDNEILKYKYFYAIDFILSKKDDFLILWLYPTMQKKTSSRHFDYTLSKEIIFVFWLKKKTFPTSSYKARHQLLLISHL